MYRSGILVACFALLLSGCATYDDRVAPVPVPVDGPDTVVVDGATLLARGYADPEAARDAFGFDVRGAGLLPVQVVIDNQSGERVALLPGNTLLIDDQGNAWPLLSSDQAAERVRGAVASGEAIRSGAQRSLLTGLAGAVAGAAIGIVTGENVAETAGKGAAAGAAIGAIGGGASRYANVGTDIQSDLSERSLQDRVIQPGVLGYGFLFFPGREEANSASTLRLAIRIGDRDRVINLPVQPMAGAATR